MNYFSPRTFYSNHVEQLYVYLKQTLFSPQTHPFTRRLVAVASPALKSWLMLRLAKDPHLGIAAGMEIESLDEVVKKLRLKFSSQLSSQKIPTLNELGFAIEIELRKICRHFPSFPDQDKKKFSPLMHYLHAGKNEKRLLSLSLELAEWFLQYGKYGHKMLSNWLSTPDSELAWQQRLWKDLFHSGSPWSFLSKELLENFSLKEGLELQINLFSIGYLPPLYHRFFEKISQGYSVNYFMLSPCQHFWSDIRSDKEVNYAINAWRQKKTGGESLMALEDFLRNRNPLLANFGRIGREMAELVENSISNLHEHYFAPKAASACDMADAILPHNTEWFEGGDLTLLQAVQTDMLILKNPQENQKINFSESDKSIQIHGACSKQREIEALHNVLMDLINQHTADADPIAPQDIIVMAPDINDYAPYIRSVFEAQGSTLDVQIMDLRMPSQNPAMQTFLQLISLSSSRWDASTLLNLLEFPHFRKKHKLEKEDIFEIKEWIQKAEIRWGNDSKHRENLLANDHGTAGDSEQGYSGTWDFGFQRLLAGMVYADDQNGSLHRPIDPLPMENSKTELFSIFLQLFNALQIDLKRLCDRTELPLKDWAVYLKGLQEKYLVFDDDDESRETLEGIFSAFESASKYFSSHKFTFFSVKQHIEGLLNAKKTTYHQSRLHAVTFCSLLPMRTIPSKVIVMLGLQEGSYPRREQNKSLNLLTQYPAEADYRPSQTDFDRYLFLEALLSARQYFVLSYLSVAEDDFKEQGPSLLILELLDYLDKAYTINERLPSKLCSYKHPFHAFNQIYFNDNSPLKSYSKNDFRLALSYYQTQKNPPFQFIPVSSPTWQASPTKTSALFQSPACEIKLTLKDLSAFAKNPLKTYFNKKLKMFLPHDDEQRIEIDEPLLLSHLKMDALKKNSLKKSMREIMAYAENKGYFAPGLFKEVACKELEEKITELHGNLNAANINPAELFEIEMSEDYTSPYCSETGNWFLPALKVKNKDESFINISGKIKEVSPKGLLEYAKDKHDLAKFWPKFLVFHALIKQYNLPIEPHVIFAKSGEVKAPFFEFADKYLLKFMEYYFLGMNCPSPLIAEWVPIFIAEEPPTLMEKLKDTLKDSDRFYNNYAMWLFKHHPIPIDICEWKPIALQLYGEAFENWFSRKAFQSF